MILKIACNMWKLIIKYWNHRNEYFNWFCMACNLKVRTLTCSRWRLLKASTVSRGFRQQGVSHAVQRTLKKKYTTGPSERIESWGLGPNQFLLDALVLFQSECADSHSWWNYSHPIFFVPTALSLDNKVYCDAIRFNELVL